MTTSNSIKVKPFILLVIFMAELRTPIQLCKLLTLAPFHNLGSQDKPSKYSHQHLFVANYKKHWGEDRREELTCMFECPIQKDPPKYKY